jgi:outer membrane biosynthesis protein TonB
MKLFRFFIIFHFRILHLIFQFFYFCNQTVAPPSEASIAPKGQTVWKNVPAVQAAPIDPAQFKTAPTEKMSPFHPRAVKQPPPMNPPKSRRNSTAAKSNSRSNMGKAPESKTTATAAAKTKAKTPNLQRQDSPQIKGRNVMAGGSGKIR